MARNIAINCLAFRLPGVCIVRQEKNVIVMRGICTAVLAVFLVGFGVCGASGTFAGLAGFFQNSGEGRGFAPVLLIAGLLGFAIAWGCWKAIASLWRKPEPPAE
jgi:hypothetical protein